MTHQNIIYDEIECQILCLRDVSALKNLTKAEEDKKMTSLLTASVSHELLTPLKCIG